MPELFSDDLASFLAIFPPRLLPYLEELPDKADLQEVVLDLGRPAVARLRTRAIPIDGAVTREDLDYVISKVGDFSADHRAALPAALHRISSICNRRGTIIGLTCRVGRALTGTLDTIKDIIDDPEASVLLLGCPGRGKTSRLREAAFRLSTEGNRRVLVVDTSNEIAGDGDLPHPAIGLSRRMQVPNPDEQYAVMLEAVCNHNPEVIIIDELGNEKEALAARAISDRGVKLIATAHGNTIHDVLSNPDLQDILGGIQPVILGDAEAKRRGTKKTVLERKAPPTFDVLVEIQDWETLIVYPNVAEAVDAILLGQEPGHELRTMHGNEIVLSRTAAQSKLAPLAGLYPYGISRDHAEQAIRHLNGCVSLVRRPEQAAYIVTTKRLAERHDRMIETAVENGAQLIVLQKNSYAQILRAIGGIPECRARQ